MKEDERKRHLLAMIGGRTFKLLANLVAPQKLGEVEYEAIHRVLQEHFKPRPNKLPRDLDSTSEISNSQKLLRRI